MMGVKGAKKGYHRVHSSTHGILTRGPSCSAEDAEVEVKWDQAENIVPQEMGSRNHECTWSLCWEAPEALFPENRTWGSQASFTRVLGCRAQRRQRCAPCVSASPRTARSLQAYFLRSRSWGSVHPFVEHKVCSYTRGELASGESLSLIKITEAYQTLRRPAPKISLEVIICY